jgi:cytochrome P450
LGPRSRLVFDSDAGRGTIFMMNPPNHTQVRKALAKSFTPGAVKKMEDDLRAQARACLAEVLPTGKMDVIRDLAAQLSVQVACKIIGLPTEDGRHLAGIVHRYFAREPGVKGMAGDALQAAMELHEYLIAAAQQRRKDGVERFDDALSILLSQDFADGGPFDDGEMAGQLMTLLVGGTETLPKVFAGGILQLARHPEQRAALVANPAAIGSAFTEIARYEMPTNFLSRKVKSDIELRGKKLCEGQGVILLYRSANRDAAEFDEPDRFNIDRKPPRTLAFGHGTHVCVGQHAAKLEARIMYEELLSAVPEYEVPEAGVVRAESEFVAGYIEMPIEFEPRELA